MRKILLIVIVLFCCQSAESAYWAQSYNTWDGAGPYSYGSTEVYEYCIVRNIFYTYDDCGFISVTDNTTRRPWQRYDSCTWWGVGFWYNPSPTYYPKPTWYTGGEGTGPDTDRDGYFAPNPACNRPGNDCNDNDATIHPGAVELCDGKDNNCNGQTDEGFALGIPCSVGIGACKRDGVAICSPDGAGTVCNATPGQPSPEVCDGIDNDCNGAIDDLPPQTCYSGPPFTAGVEICKTGTQYCENGAWSACLGEVTPQEEKCDGIDNNCNGKDDEVCQCNETRMGSSASISTGNYRHTEDVSGNVTLIYNSNRTSAGSLGKGWIHSYDTKVKVEADGSLEFTEDGTAVFFRVSGGIYKSEPRSGIPAQIVINPDNSYTLTKKEGAVYQFDSSGRLLSITDRNENQTILTYTGGLLSAVTDSHGRITQFIYAASNKINQITDPAGRNTTLSYNTAGLLSSVTNPDGSSWTYNYDASGRMVSKTDPAGSTTANVYDSQGRMIQATDSEGNIKTISYDQINQTSTVTEWNGGVWTYKYDDYLNVQTEITDPNSNVRRKTYDSSKNLLSETDELGKTTNYTYDPDGNMLTTTDPAGNTTTYTYNTFGQTASVTTPDGKITAYSYDPKGNLLSLTDPSGAVSIYTYDTNGQVLTSRDPEGRTTSYIYDTYGNISTVTLFDGNTYTFTYNISGNLLSQTDPQGNTTTYEYDLMGNLKKVTDPSGTSAEYTYDSLGRKTSMKDGNGNSTHYEYNYKGQLTKVTDAIGNITIYTYGTTGCPSCGGGGDKLTSVTDGNGNTTTYEYDLLGRLTKETDPEENEITYAYDAAGNLISKTDATGVTITYTYDALKRLTTINYPDTTQNINYTYDSTGKVLTMTDQSGTTTYTYDNSNRLISETKSIDGKSFTNTYTYTTGGSLSSITYPGGRTVSYNKDNNGRIINVTETKGGATKDVITNITYNTNSAVSSLTYGNGIVTTKTYDSRGSLNSLNIGTLKELSYTRDNVGNITAINDFLDQTKTKTYAYDAIYRLTQATGPWGSINYSYDPVGNRTVETASAGTTNYSYDANKLISSTGAKAFTFSYDNNGNTISENQRQYIYNQNQRLIKAVGNGNTLGEYTYNGNGQRVKKVANGKTIYYIYDQSGNLIEEADGNGEVMSDYIYLGSTPIGRVDIQWDTVPPATDIVIGDPKYQSLAELYITASTFMTLTAADPGDNPSGVDHTEYRIDDEPLWIAYVGAFNLSNYANGIHTIQYRSVDKAGNAEEIKTQTLTLDKTSPSSGINIGIPGYQSENNLYIGGNTPITITAEDSGSGIGKIEYAVDEGAYNIYTGAFTLASCADGRHVVRYRSSDNVSNIEMEKTVTLTLDKTPPSTTITAGDPLTSGMINTVSPKTMFFLNSSDDLSGLREMQYRIDGGNWSTYLTGFSLPSVAGLHAIVYKAIDNLGNEETEKTLTVKMIVIDVTKGISLEPVVLAGAWGSTPGIETSINTLTSILSSSGLNYYIPQTEEEFRESLRTGRYNTYLFVDFNVEELKDELREAINYGEGLVYIKTIPNTIPALQDVFGVQFKGMSTYRNLLVNLTESPISAPSTLQTADKDIKTTITSPTARSLGYVIDKNSTYPVIVLNQYGRGKVILFSFDLLKCTDRQKVKDLIINSIRYVTPTEYNTRALGDTRISINIRNSTEPVDIKVTETIPANTGVDFIAPPATQTENTIQWQLSLGSNENKKLGYWLLLPDLSGGYQTDTEVRYSNQGDYRLYGNYGLTINVLNNSAELIQHIIADLQTLQVTGSDVTYVNKALYNLNLINDYEGVTKPEAQNNINHILNALKELEKVSIDVSSIRLKIDELLRIWQVKWNLAAEVVSRVERYRLVYETDVKKIEKHAVVSSCPSFPQSVSGNPERRDIDSCFHKNDKGDNRKPVLVASTGSLSGLLNSPASNEVLYFYHTDHLGTPIMMTDSSGNKVWEGEFLPFGESLAITGTIKNNLRFPGQYYDAETGLHQNWHREYKPEIGRYISEDPLRFKGGDVNFYVYVGNNSVNLKDPKGLTLPSYNYCGPGNKPNTDPTNDLDTCCMVHDNCYADGGAAWNKRNVDCTPGCDKDLCNCMKGVNPNLPFFNLIYIIFKCWQF
ncbi:MAG: hypothetical protein FJ240_10620 [Nitrospira sp.]|nr:hypothetical protein [Nitrospira sp.]